MKSLLFVGVVKNGSYVYAVVAGPEVKQVERLRNEHST